jgi:hypothetical protein
MSSRLMSAAFSLLLTACSTATFSLRGPGVGDTYPEHPPYHAGAKVTPAALPNARTGVLPVYYQPGASQPDIFDPRWGPGTPIGSLLAEMNAYLDSLTTGNGATLIRLADASHVSAVAPTTLGVPPDVRFGCLTDGDLPGEECVPRGDSTLGRQNQRMKLMMLRPTNPWITWAGEVMRAQDVTSTLVISLEIGSYLPRQRGLLGRKSVELGTGHTAELPWLTSLETPVTVLQLTGALIDRQGQAIRIGAEGMYARRTPLLVSAVGGQALLRDDDLTTLRTRRRDDLPGRPLVWQAAMRELVRQLTK